MFLEVFCLKLVAFPPDYGLNGGHEEEEEEVKAGSPSCSPSEGRRGLSIPPSTQISDPELHPLWKSFRTSDMIQSHSPSSSHRVKS